MRPKRQECGGQRKGPEPISGTRSPRHLPVDQFEWWVPCTPSTRRIGYKRARAHTRAHEMTVGRRGETMMTVVTLFIGPVLGMSADKNQTVRARPVRVPRSTADRPTMTGRASAYITQYKNTEYAHAYIVYSRLTIGPVSQFTLSKFERATPMNDNIRSQEWDRRLYYPLDIESLVIVDNVRVQ